jgi:DNA-binding transcriptional ArsR family regulator
MSKKVREKTYMEEVENEDFPMECKEEHKSVIKLVSRRRYFSIVCKWMLQHNAEPHNVTEISLGSGVNAGSVSFAVRKLNDLGVVHLHRVEKLDRKEKLYSINESAAKLIVQRYLWLVSFKLLKVLPKRKDNISLDELKTNNEFIQILRKYKLSFEESLESLRLNHYVEILLGREREPYAIKLKDLPTHYFKEEKQEVEEVEEIG